MLMESTRVTESRSNHFPLDVWSEILSRFPVKPLLRFRSVSKPWNLLIDDPPFCRLHFNQFKNNSDETHLLFLQERMQEHGLSVCSETFEPTKILSLSVRSDISPTTYSRNVNFIICFSVDGLLLLQSYWDGDGLMLWNPSIRKCRSLPPLVVIFPDLLQTVELGLGFDPLIKDYKIVRVCLQNKAHPVAVYTVGTSIWKQIEFRGRGCSNRSWHVDAQSWLVDAYKSTVYLRGGLYFISESKELISFDLSGEMFTFANLPVYDDDDDDSRCSLGFVDGGCSLAVIRLKSNGGSFWALDNSNSDATLLCWTKRYTFTRSIDRFFYLKKSGDLLFGCLGYKANHRLISYNIETRKEKLLPESICSGEITQMCSYKESLVLLKDPGVHGSKKEKEKNIRVSMHEAPQKQDVAYIRKKKAKSNIKPGCIALEK